MNFALLQRMLTVSGPRGEVAGTISVGREESSGVSHRRPRGRRLLQEHRYVARRSPGTRSASPTSTFDHVTARITTTATSLVFEIRSTGSADDRKR
jgi:hypothetical protein